MSNFKFSVLTSARQCSRHLISRSTRQFHQSRRIDVVKPFLLADIGEGITECQLIQWFVQPGARVEQFDKLCEVQSDKASVEITSPFDGVIKKLHYEPDDMAITGKPLVDIDIQGELCKDDEAKLGGSEAADEHSNSNARSGSGKASDTTKAIADQYSTDEMSSNSTKEASLDTSHLHPRSVSSGGSGTLATPAVRRMTKEYSLDIADVQGSGKDGRVLKEDIHRHIARRDKGPSCVPANPRNTGHDRKVNLTPVQSTMYKVMSRSLNIPHFLYSCAADMTAVTDLRKRLNAKATNQSKITHLPFIIKAVSLAFQNHPILNSTLDTKDPQNPTLIHRGSHNFAIAVDSPAGLLVPVLRDVQDFSISDIANEIRRLADAARENKLTPSDFSGASFTISNIGSVGGGVVAPVISEPQVAILGIGRSKLVPAFNEAGDLIKKEELIFSWSADHRVVDGAECARCAERVSDLLEDPASMLVGLR